MQNEETEPITKVTQVITNPDGSQAKIVAQSYYSGANQSSKVDVFRRDSENEHWQYCSDQPHPNWREMSVDEYKQRGRSPALQAVSIGQILKVGALLGQPMSVLKDFQDRQELVETAMEGVNDAIEKTKAIAERSESPPKF